MGSFAFIIHPLDSGDVARKFPFTRYLPERVVEGLLKYAPPVKTSHITGIRSAQAEAEGWFIGCTLTSRQMMTLPVPFVLRKIIAAGQVAEKLGAKIVGLGAFTSVVGDAGVTVARHLGIPVTTGNSYTVATALEGTKEAARIMGIDLRTAQVVIVGATGSIGSACARIMARDVRYLTMVGRDSEKLEGLARRIVSESGLSPRLTTDLKAALVDADIIITVSSATGSIIMPELLKPGAVVCDVARPRDVSKLVVEKRDDVLVIEGGVVQIPGDVDFNLNFGFPPRTGYACMAETILLALEERYESFTLGREISVEKVDEISRLARKHGFRLAGFRSFDRAVTREDIERIRRNAFRKKSQNAVVSVSTTGK